MNAPLRRRFQFSLRTLLLTATIAGLLSPTAIVAVNRAWSWLHQDEWQAVGSVGRIEPFVNVISCSFADEDTEMEAAD